MDRAHRLSSSRDLRRVLRRGKRATRGVVTCVAEPTDRPGPPRVAVSVTRKQGGAVKRNRAKRRLREAARRHLDALQDGTDAVLVARGDIGGCSWQELETQVKAAMAGASR